ncbi:MAG: metalloprotease PmbA [Pseudomonadota bacterium]
MADQLLAAAQAAGADAAEVSASNYLGLSATVRLGEVETLEYSQDRGVNVTVFFGQQKGGASTADLSQASLKRTVEHACAIARHTQPDSCNGLADAALMAEAQPDLDLWAPWALEPEQAIELALAAETAGRDVDERIDNSEGATVATGSSLALYANSHGFRGHRRATRHSVSCVLVARDDEGMQRDYWYDTRRHAGDLSSAQHIGEEAGRRVLARCGARPLKTTKAPVLFVPETARTLLGHLVSAVSGSNLYRGSSFLKDRVGDQLFPDFVNIAEHPGLLRGLRSTPFDSEGVATRERRLIDAGVLTGYVLGSYSARRLGLETTANAGGVHNLTLEPGAQSLEDLIGGLSRGLVVTEMMGQGVNITNGDYSRGAAGFWIESGQIAHPVEGVTIAGNLEQLFAGIQAVGADLDERSAIRSGSLLIDQMTIAGD